MAEQKNVLRKPKEKKGQQQKTKDSQKGTSGGCARRGANRNNYFAHVRPKRKLRRILRHNRIADAEAWAKKKGATVELYDLLKDPRWKKREDGRLERRRIRRLEKTVAAA